MNRITATGRPVRDCVLTQTTNDRMLCKFILACKSDYKIENQTKTNFIRCVAWDKAAEILINHVKQGDLICVAGTLDSREVERHEKQDKEIVWEIKVEKVELLAKNEKRRTKISRTNKRR